MIDALHISESGLKANQKWIDTISNNIANIQTAGFKRTTAQFSDIVGLRGSSSSNNAHSMDKTETIGLGTLLSGNRLSFTTGPAQPTGNALDFAINGAGFIEVILENGENAYTRLGRLKISSNGDLTTLNGMKLGDGIRLPPDVRDLEITSNGNVVGKVGPSQDSINFGQIHITQISNPESMNELGNGVFGLNEESNLVSSHVPGEGGTGTLLSKYLEMSNVDLTEEMTSLVLAQRAYQLNARIIQTVDQVMETINNLRR